MGIMGASGCPRLHRPRRRNGRLKKRFAASGLRPPGGEPRQSMRERLMRPKSGNPGKPSRKIGAAANAVFSASASLPLVGRLGVLLRSGFAPCRIPLVDPPTTALRLERRAEALFRPGRYAEQWHPVPLSRISPHLRHAVIAAEDGNFYRHWGFDFDQIEIAVKEDFLERGRLRGASTITQQLVKNLFLGTRGSFARKVLEAPLVPLAELLLGKDRILEIYLNQAEWGPAVFGAEAAAEFHYRTSARALSRQQATRLSAVLPSPLRRRPAMNRYSAVIMSACAHTAGNPARSRRCGGRHCFARRGQVRMTLRQSVVWFRFPPASAPCSE